MLCIKHMYAACYIRYRLIDCICLQIKIFYIKILILNYLLTYTCYLLKNNNLNKRLRKHIILQIIFEQYEL